MIPRRYVSRLGNRLTLLLAIASSLWICAGWAEPNLVTGIPVKFVHGEAVYLQAGSSTGLAEGQRLLIRRNDLETSPGEIIGEIEIESVAPASAAGRVVYSKVDIVPGDTAYLSKEGLQNLRENSILKDKQKYLQVASFTDGAPTEQEIRENIPKPPLPEINRFRGRVAVDSSFLQIPGAGVKDSQFGFMLRLDATRLGGSYWSITGYHRGRIQATTDYQQQTLTDLINRTYHLSINYDSPKSNWLAGAGRLYVPWANSLSTIDGFYIARRFGKQTVGVFGGTNPDPTSWNYDPHRQMAGAFINFERGSFESMKFTSTSGIAVSRVHWQPDRQFAFFENAFFYKYYLAVYGNLEADFLTGAQTSGNREVKLSRSYWTIRIQPHKIIAFDLNENYFRNIPTFDTRLIGTGLLDKFLFQGVSGGFRLALPYRLGIYANTGRSSRTGDGKPSWNYLGGATVGDILHSGIRLDYRYSRFDSSFGRGTYQSLSADREIGEKLRFELQAGRQAVSSTFTAQSRAKFITGNVDWYLNPHYFIGLGLTVYRGQQQKYGQYFFSAGYRFDNRRIRHD